VKPPLDAGNPCIRYKIPVKRLWRGFRRTLIRTNGAVEGQLHMAQWLVTQGNHQFAVDSFDELEAMARRGQLSGGDMLQPPGSADWVYVSEVPDLKHIVSRNRSIDDEITPPSRGLGNAMIGAIGLALVALIVVGGGFMLYLAQQMPDPDAGILGEGGLSFSQMIVTEHGTGLRDEPADGGRVTHALQKDEVLELLAKRHEFYRARTSEGIEGWIPTNHVIPMYQLGGIEVRDELDPLYNPDRYVTVSNARWMQLPKDPKRPGTELSNVTVFEFMVTNEAPYAMTDLVLLATIKDAKGHELEKVEIPVEGVIGGRESTMVGTLGPPEEKGKPAPDAPVETSRVLTSSTFDEMAQADPDLQLRWTSGVEVEMATQEFTNAEIDILELRAVPDTQAEALVRRP
jgi:hypothetical protein